MIGAGTQVEPIELEANGMHFSGIAAGPRDGQLCLLLHGWPQFADSWTIVAQILGSLGFRAVAVDQRGYSPTARPAEQDAYAMQYLVSDVLGFADALGAPSFHLIAHDWGAIVGWHVAQAHPGRVASFTSLAIPHPAALAEAIANDPDQQQRGAYVTFFRAPGNVAEKALLDKDALALRGVYEGKISPATVDEHVRRLSEPGAMTAVLNWYRANDFRVPLDPVSVPVLYIWGSRDRALGERAARNTAQFVTGPYRFEVVDTTHWIVDEIPRETVALIQPILHVDGARSVS